MVLRSRMRVTLRSCGHKYMADKISIEENSLFPGDIKLGPFESQIVHQGIISSFREGAIYRYPGFVPLLDVCGDHFEIGLQYGALMRQEILDTLAAYNRIITWLAESMGIPLDQLKAKWHGFARAMIDKIPHRFFEEAQGISLGSGVPVDSILMVTFAYDFGMAGGCTSVLMKGKNDRIIHARNNDTAAFGGAELGRLTAVVRRRVPGYQPTVQVDYPLLIGIESGYNLQGLAFTEETLKLRQPNPDLFSLNILVRMILEECVSLEELPAYFDRYPVIAGYGEIWSSQRQGQGWLVEQTPYGWSKKELESDILWNFNTIYDPQLKKYEALEKILHSDSDREAVARNFPRKNFYDVQDGIDFIRATFDGKQDYIHFGTRRGVCNEGTQQAMVFDPSGGGLYLAWGEQYCSRANFYYIHEDFSIPPDLIAPQMPLSEKMIERASVKLKLDQPVQKLEGYLRLANKYSDDADFQFQAAHLAFTLCKHEIFVEFAEKAFYLQPQNAEYRLYGGIAAFWTGDEKAAIQRLESIDPQELFLREEMYRLTLLERLSPLPHEYHARLEEILSQHNVGDYYHKEIVPQILR